MKRVCFILTTAIFFCFHSYGQKSKKGIAYPFKEILKNVDTLIVRGSPRNNRSSSYDTLFKPEIEKLANLPFLKENIQVEKYGVTPGGSISLFHKMERVVLIGSWDINKKYYAVNISINEKFRYHGLIVLKETFDELFTNIHRQVR